MGRVDVYPNGPVAGPPSAQLGYAEITTTQGSITTVTDITGLAVTITVPAGRRIKITVEAGVNSNTVTDGVDVQICEGATVLQDRTAKLDTNAEVAIHTDVILTPSAGTHTYKVRASRFAGSGSVTFVAASNKPAYILVEDITGTFWNGVPVTNPPACRVFHNAAQSIAHNTATTLAFNSERYDTDTMHDNVTSNSRITIKTAGVYSLSTNIRWQSAAGNSTRLVRILLNNATTIAETQIDGATGAIEMIASCDYKLAVSDFIETQVYQFQGGSLNIEAVGNLSPEFSASWVALG